MATTTKKPADEQADQPAANEAAALAAIDKKPAELSEAEALSFIQAFGRVPAGWTFDPRAGVRKLSE